MKMVRLGIVLLLNAMAPDLAGGAAASGATALSTTDSDSGHEMANLGAAKEETSSRNLLKGGDTFQTQPTAQAQAVTIQTCGNGIEGIQGDGVVCCPIGCSQCGDAGCYSFSTSGGAEFGSDSCCGGDIVASGVLCSESGSAPCLIDQGASTTPISADCAAKRGVAGYDVVLLMGQSNMGGSGQGYNRTIDGPNNPRVQQWSRANTIITASERLEHADMGTISQTLVGMGTAFGRALVDTLPLERNVLLVPTAYRGSQLVDGPWTPGGDLFEDAVTRMTAALASDYEAGNCVAAVLWHQGEADAGARVDQETYRSTWADMITTLRARIPAAAGAPVVLGEFTPAAMEASNERFSPILAAVREIPDYVPFTVVASSEGLTSNSDDDLVHFDAASQREFGQRYFDKLADAIENSENRRSESTFPKWVIIIVCVHLWRFR